MSEETPMWLTGEGDFDHDIVGESHYQDALLSICGPKTEVLTLQELKDEGWL